MAAAVGVTEAQAKKLVLKMPALLTSSKDDTVQGAVAWLRQFFPSTGAVKGKFGDGWAVRQRGMPPK
jgi:hypothetical protein